MFESMVSGQDFYLMEFMINIAFKKRINNGFKNFFSF